MKTKTCVMCASICFLDVKEPLHDLTHFLAFEVPLHSIKSEKYRKSKYLEVLNPLRLKSCNISNVYLSHQFCFLLKKKKCCRNNS